jgi:hypothetical protein
MHIRIYLSNQMFLIMAFDRTFNKNLYQEILKIIELLIYNKYV